ncbi:MAG: hypothetical protein HKN70_05315 [Gammaproteobacteria bacterium]|nr:hypothetical protein [Gammaproteobacteria bacterium]
MPELLPRDTRFMTGSLRLLTGVAAILLIVSGSFGLYLIVRLLMLHPGDLAYLPFGQKEMIFRALWGIVAIAFVATGLSLLLAAIRRRHTNMVPGPTLYILGAALVIISMFLISDGGWLSGAIIAAAGLATMWLEYRSANI